jgi:hypothetical protein
MTDHVWELAQALLAELSGSSEPVSAAKLCKRLGVRMSSLQRCISYLGEDSIGGQAGPGLVSAVQDGERLLLSLTAKGRSEYEGASANDGNY